MRKIFLALLILASAALSGGNRSDYVFEVEYDHDGRKISGYEDITYSNFSADTIREIKFHMYANLFRKESSFFKKKPSEDRCGSIDADSIFISGSKAAKMQIDGTMGRLPLEAPLLPGDSLKMRIYFTNRIPAPFLREGWSRNQSDITQWYPKVAVYKNGAFADFQYTERNEFFNEYGNYTLNLTLPADMYAFGTGRLVSPQSEIAALDSMAADNPESGSKMVTSSKVFTSKKRIVLSAENVHDMAFIVAKNPSVIREERDGVTVTVTCSKASRKIYEEQINGIFDALEYFSEKYMPYPYKQLTISEGLLQAGSGMEYPEFIILGPSGSGMNIPFVKSYALEAVISHEIGHQWFYLISGSNETAEPFMDEGINTYAEISYLEHKYGESENFMFIPHITSITHFDLYYYIMRYMQNSKKSFPLASDAISIGDEGDIMLYYAKGFLAVRQMEDMAGKERFDSIMRGYVSENAFTHTDLDGFLSYLNRETGDIYYNQFRSIIYENYSNDFYFESIRNDSAGGYFVVGNRKFFDISVPVLAVSERGDTFMLRKREGNDTVFLPMGRVKQLIIDPDKRYIDLDYHNNSMKNGISVHFTPSMPDYFKSNLYVFPWADYSLYDKFSAGAIFEYCDNPDISAGGYSIRGKWSSRTFIGWNMRSSFPLIKGVFKSFDGEDRITEGYIEYEAAKQRVSVSPGIKGYQYFGNDEFYIVDVSMPVRVSFGDSDYERSHIASTLSMVKFSFGIDRKAGPVKIEYKGDFSLSDKLFYSDYDFAKFENSISVSGEVSGMTFGAAYRGGYLYGYRARENGFNLYRGPLLMFDDADASLEAYDISFAYAEGGYGYYSTDEDAYDALNRVRFFMGRGAVLYFDVIAKGKGVLTAERVMQAGIKLDAGKLISIDIPIYNSDRGLILKDNLAFTVSSGFIM